MTVEGTRACRSLISVRICARSFASRLESGSSNRKTSGFRTIARPIATRLRRPPVQEVAEMEDVARLRDARIDFGLRALGDLEREGHVLAHAHMRIERVGLEHHRDVARARRKIVDDLAADP